METIKFDEVLRVCADFVTNPNNESHSALCDLQRKITIKSYLPMADKVVVLFKIMNDSDQPVDTLSSVFTIGVEVACLFDGLLAYTNIDSNIDFQYKNYENYDILQQSGIADYILEYCEKDYRVLAGLIDRTINYGNLMDLLTTLRGLNLEKAEDISKQIRNAHFDLDPSIIRDVADILRYNNPNLYKLNNLMEDEALDKVLRADKIEKINKNK